MTHERSILHADMDAFYASIEQLDRPSLRGKPVIVGPNSARGVVLTASYEARPWRVGSALPMAIALRRCPQAIVVPPRFERYREVSAQVMRVFRDFSPRVEAISLDEAFLDMTGSAHIFGEPAAAATRLKQAIELVTGGLTASIGVSNSKYVAKVASGYSKPDGLTVVPARAARDWLSPLPISTLWGAGPKAQQKLNDMGLATLGQVAAADPDWLESRLGRIGRRFHELAQGIDNRPVEFDRPAQSLSCERTLTSDTRDRRLITTHLRKAADTVAARLRSARLAASGVRVKLKRTDFRVVSRQRMLAEPTNGSAEIFGTAVALADSMLQEGPFRLIGIAAFALDAHPASQQLDLPGTGSDRASRLDALVDQVSQRFGAGAIRRASQPGDATVLADSPDLDFLVDRDGGRAD